MYVSVIGDLLRKYIQGGNDDARRLKHLMNEGQIVPAEVLLPLELMHLPVLREFIEGPVTSQYKQ